ncbi:uncharacterized protein LOC128262023 [Drosophila gunungcola]|uniref:uncharacterized protein LOC128262023 n=1 Tax=Drosophila gunungcola TaxID=103775 RepID=UPI0022E6EA29|nr:uncharacterized protein LOC128262023 [Drosophila gunungcola]
MVCRFNPFYIGPVPPSCCTDLNPDCNCPACSPDTGYQEPRPVNEDCKGVSKKETKESKCNPPCKEAPKKEKSKKPKKKDTKNTK